MQQNRLLKEYQGAAKVKVMPPLDMHEIETIVKQGKDENIPFRFGVGFDTHITLADGEWRSVKNGRLWTMTFASKGAYSINFVFNDFYLPEGAELYISNEKVDMLYGPVTSKENTENGHFLTDLIKGDKVTIYLFEPSNKINKTRLTIKRVVHAYKNMFSDAAYGRVGNSGNCNNNVACFPAWSQEANAVALVLLSNGTEWCSGSLLMTTNQSFRPYFLSAFHCIDKNHNNELSTTEISDAENWMFKFQYKMSSCSGGSVTSGITYNRATFRAAWNNTDFALMELRNSLIGDSRVSWLGWDRSGNTPSSGTGIHHPSGDVMKISFDNQQLQISSWGGVNNHWLLNFDDGVVEHGSSGSPLFDQNKRVIGQLHGNQNYNSGLSYCEQYRAEYGQFHRSWIGGGTNNTRLSNWLNPTGSVVMTTNTSRAPILSGPSTICNQSTYNIANLPQGASVQWSTSNSNLQLISGQGDSTAVFKKNYNGNCTIEVNISVEGATIPLEKTVWVGNVLPLNLRATDMTTGNIVYAICRNQPTAVRAKHIGGQAFINNWQWTGSNVVIENLYPSSDVSLRPLSDNITVKLRAHNSCGWTEWADLGLGVMPCGAWYMAVFPNPANNFINIALTSTGKSKNIDISKGYQIQLWQNYNLIKTIRTKSLQTEIPISSLKTGYYYVVVVINGKKYKQQFFKQ